ncbi:MAG: hypothetical protein NTZ74_01605 [Chloroflexi bacterium]|nr:hypothetical protein [Chloroflexota bacterium]
MSIFSKASATLFRLSPLRADGALPLRKNIGCLFEQGTLRPQNDAAQLTAGYPASQ